MCFSVIEMRPAAAAEIRPLRDSVLRSPYSEYPGDDAPETLHLAAYAEDTLVAIGSLCRDPLPEQPALTWRIRGMATHPDWQRQGIGSRLVQHLCAYALTLDAEGIWLQAREHKRTFYQKLGFRETGPLYGIPEHPDMQFIKMIKSLIPQA